VLAALVVLSLRPELAIADRTRGDTIRAARMLGAWRYDEARELIGKLHRARPKATETRYLRAELAFVDGEYQRALELIDGIDDDAVSGNVGSLRRLAATTAEATRDLVSVETPHFVIQYARGDDEVIVGLASEVLEAAYREIGADLDWHPANKVRVEILGDPSDLAKVSTLTETEIDTTGTIALCKYNKLMIVSPRATVYGYPWMDTLVHEYVHYVVSRKSHDRVPVWLHEGLAKFEQTRWRKKTDASLTPTDESLLASALKSGRLITFDQMHPSMAKLPSAQAAALAFAEVYTMVGFIHDAAGYEGLRAAIDKQREGRGARRAVAEVMNTRWPKLERAWRRHLRRLKLKSQAGAESRARARIHFRRGSSGNTENVGVDAVASARARKHARLGGMLRARGMAAAAAAEYERALAADPDDAFVAGKLSRTYLQLRKHTKAAALAAPLLELDENDSTAATTLGLARLAAGEVEKAAAAFEIALRVNPFDPAVRCGLADAYAELGDKTRETRERAACTKLRP
jgi:tetratricopeptide (TPR) repeat protein